MRRAMADVEVGDDVLREDPTVNRLEEEAAEAAGKEAALLVPSGTFGNQLALFTHCARGEEVVLSQGAHIVQHEAGAAAVIAGVQLRTFQPLRSYPSWEEVARQVRRGQDIHYPRTGLVALENALSDGSVMPPEVMAEIGREAAACGVPVHLDGARIFNAALALGVEAAQIAAPCDSVMFCLSKGLCAPVGSLLAGGRELIELARRKRKIMGGGMRQAGVLAAAGLVGLREMRKRLGEDHEKAGALAARFLASGLFEVRPQPVRINMFFVRFRPGPLQGMEEALVAELATRGVRTYPPEDGWARFVTHHDVDAKAVERAGEVLEGAMETLERRGAR